MRARSSFQMKLTIILMLAVAIIGFASGATAATVESKVEGESSILTVGAPKDFEGTDASILATDPSTLEVRIPGANFSVQGKKQLFRFEEAYVKAASVSVDGENGILRFTLKNKGAAQVADLVKLTRSNEVIRVEIPNLADTEIGKLKALTEAKEISIPATTALAQTEAKSIEPKLTESKSSEDTESSGAKKKSTMVDEKSASAGSTAVAAASAQPKAESEIPVLATAKVEKKETTSSLERLVLTMFVLCVFLAAAVFALKRWSIKKGQQKTGTKIQILTQHHLGPKKSLAIIQVAGEALLIGITDQNISMLKTLALIDDEVPGLVPKNFSDEMDRDITRASLQQSGDEFQSAADEIETEAEENFAMRGLGEVRDMVSTRLKGLRNLQ